MPVNKIGRTTTQMATRTGPQAQQVETPEVVASKEVAVAEEQGRQLAVMADSEILAHVTADDEWADVNDGDLDPESMGRIPHLLLNRKLDGGFVDPDTGESFRELDFIWLAKSRSRAYWPEGFGKGNRAPDCRSSDGIRPDASSPTPMDDLCATCAMGQWNGDEAPPCKASIEALIFIPDTYGEGRLARLRFGGIAAKPANEFWQSFSTRVPRKPPIAFITHVELVEQQTDNGKFLAPRFTIAAEIPRSQANGLIAERDRRLADWKADTGDDLAAGTTAADEDADPQPVPNGEPF